jgi:hypothetical protein
MDSPGWAVKELVLHELRFHPDYIAPFSPACEEFAFPPLAKAG